MRLTFVGVILGLGLGCGGSPTTPTPTPSHPTITCPSPINVTTVVPAGAAISYTTPTASGGQAPVAVACTPPSGTTFPVGSTMVSCTATDAASHTGSCQFPVALTLAPTLTRTTFLAFGDSTTSGEVTVPTTIASADGFPNFKLIVMPSASYPTQLQNMLSSRYYTQAIAMTNAGKPGEWAADGVLRFPGVMTSVRPEVVMLLEGYNDQLQTSLGMTEAVAAMESMAKEARNRGARVFLANLTPGRPGGRNTIPNNLLTSFNDRLRIIATGEQAVFVNLYDALNADVNTYIGIDGLHPTEAGYRRMADTFFAAIRTDLEVK